MWYNKKILKLFLQPQHAGEFAPRTADVVSVRVGNPGQTDVIQLQIVFMHHIVSDAKFKVQGGVATIAAAEYVASNIKNKGINELLAINSQTIIDALQLPEQRYHAAVLASTALQQLIIEIKNDR